MSMARQLSCAALLAACFSAAQAQRPVAYPSQGQGQARQDRDDGECQVWARKETGVDPAALAANPPSQETGPAVGGDAGAQRSALDEYNRAWNACMRGRGYTVE